MQMLRELFSKEKAARGFDMNLAVKASKGGWLLGAAVGFALEPFYPPTARIGSAGWLVTAGLGAATGIWINILIRRPERVTRDTLLVTAYFGLMNIAVAQCNRNLYLNFAVRGPQDLSDVVAQLEPLRGDVEVVLDDLPAGDLGGLRLARRSSRGRHMKLVPERRLLQTKPPCNRTFVRQMRCWREWLH